MVTSYIGLGSNLGDRKKNLLEAVRLLGADPGIKVESKSSFYETAPQECPPHSPRFLNAAIKINTYLNPPILLKKLKLLEARMGRRNSKKRFSPRPIDLDILLYGNKNITLPNLNIPHPRLNERTFVLKPLKDIAPAAIKNMAKEMKIITSISGMRAFLSWAKSKNKTIGFVPTMGYLHPGHLSLIKQAKMGCDICVVSIFVNPLQFGPKEDYQKYPQELELDRILAKSAGADAIFHPDVKEMYPDNYFTYVNVEKLTAGLCGESRPGHFKGVTTVVAKLFNIIQPDIAYFGQKDYQQAIVIKKMSADLNMPLKIKIMPTVREPDGLALSSRNSYLNAQERIEALCLYQALQKAKALIHKGEKDRPRIIKMIRTEILKNKSAKIDYVTIADPQTLLPLNRINGKTLIALAVWIGKTRLIDNILYNAA